MNPTQLLETESVLEHLSKNMQINFKINCDEWTPEQEQKHFENSKALITVRSLLVDTAEELHNQNQ